MKRVIIILTILAFAFGSFALIGCSKKEEPKPQVTKPAPAKPAAVKKAAPPKPAAVKKAAPEKPAGIKKKSVKKPKKAGGLKKK